MVSAGSDVFRDPFFAVQPALVQPVGALTRVRHDLDDERRGPVQPCSGEPVALRIENHEDVRLDGTVLGELHFKGCRERLADDMRLEVLLEPAGQLEHGALMDGAGGRRHDQLAPDDLVAQMVVREASDLLGGVSRHQRGHGHKMVTPRAQGQLGMGRAYRSACEAWHRGYAAGGESMHSARRPDRPFGGRVNGLRAQVRADVPRACARGQCYNYRYRLYFFRTR